jgi:hypothetical protein
MAIFVDKKMPLSEIKKLLGKSKNKRKRVNMKLFSGKINWKVNAVTYQRKLRDADR